MEKGQVDRIVSRHEMREMLGRLVDYGTSSWEGYEVEAVEPEVDENAESASEPASGSASETGSSADASGAEAVEG